MAHKKSTTPRQDLVKSDKVSDLTPSADFDGDISVALAAARYAHSASAPNPNLDDHEQKALAGITYLNGLGRTTLAWAIWTGAQLASCKRAIGHGDWRGWLDARNAPERTVQRYIRVSEWAAAQDQIQTKDMTITEALLSSKTMKCKIKTKEDEETSAIFQDINARKREEREERERNAIEEHVASARQELAGLLRKRGYEVPAFEQQTDKAKEAIRGSTEKEVDQGKATHDISGVVYHTSQVEVFCAQLWKTFGAALNNGRAVLFLRFAVLKLEEATEPKERAMQQDSPKKEDEGSEVVVTPVDDGSTENEVNSAVEQGGSKRKLKDGVQVKEAGKESHASGEKREFSDTDQLAKLAERAAKALKNGGNGAIERLGDFAAKLKFQVPPEWLVPLLKDFEKAKVALDKEEQKRLKVAIADAAVENLVEGQQAKGG